MAKSKQVKAPPVQPAQDGDIDPYSAGKKIANPEPDNGAANRPADTEPTYNNGQEIPAADTPNAEQEEQDEVAAGREEPVAAEEAPKEDAGTPAEEGAETPAEEEAEKPSETPAPVADPPVGEGETFEPSAPTTPTPSEIAEA